MSENPQQSEPDVPHDDDLDLEGPNESGPGRHPTEDESEESQDQA